MEYRSRIAGVGSYVPANIVSNDDLAKFIETSDEWISQRTGIRQRHWVKNGAESTSDLALHASQKALQQSGLEAKDLDMIVFATLSPDHEFPGTGCFLQAKLGVPNIPAFDIRQQCSGFIYALSIADQFIRSGNYRHVLVVGAEVHSTGLDKTTRGRDVTVLFGDGAGAAVVSRCEVKSANTDSYILSTHLHADGAGARELWLPAGGSAMGKSERIDREMIDRGDHYPKMNGKKVYASAVRRMSEVVLECLSANQKKIEDVDLFLFHQANLRINEAVAEQLAIPWDRVFNTIHKFGNTTAATIPLGMDEAVKAGRLKKGMLVGLAAFGSGFTWASGLLRY